jgi:predicted house-cleaning noncanonical NTP pyrophosphatase (MazG superfamily)
MANQEPDQPGSRPSQSRRRKRQGTRKFEPNRAVILATRSGIEELPASLVTADRVGLKAYGITCVPLQWVPSFYVISSDALLLSDDEFRPIVDGCNSAVIRGADRLVIRSSGREETISERGRLLTKTCAPHDVLPTVRALSEELKKNGVVGVHWIVQKYVVALRSGHLSNERRVSREQRDWLAEFEVHGNQPGLITTMGVRFWRNDSETVGQPLQCSSATGITIRLRDVTQWATSLADRAHFEWVWSGTDLWIVQCDLAEPKAGSDPHHLRPAEIPEVSLPSLKCFRRAQEADFEKFRKLRNARLYRTLGYEMPAFYIVDDQATMAAVVSDNIPAELENDLSELTKRPLIIRTDGLTIPAGKREMLPRSEGLATVNEAKTWLIDKFRAEVNRLGIADTSLCLIAHHFIPSSAAAWAFAEPNKRAVRIESLWGVPEGLYWYSHDTFEVDTGDTKLPADSSKFGIQKKLRYKGTFIAPDLTNRWITYQTATSYDWAPSIEKSAWIQEIALTTRRIAEAEHSPVIVMWFIDNDARATKHSVLPWYHGKAEINRPKAAPRRKLTTSSEATIRKRADWENLQEQVRAGKQVERITLQPSDPELIRNQDFARDLAEFAAENKIVVELAGGILSHAYYQLRRHGAEVECIDLFGADEDKAEFNKVVRDRIPEIIEAKGEAAEVVTLKGEALVEALRRKLVEESFEALDAKTGDDLIAELADALEVIQAIANHLDVPFAQVQAEQADKRGRRGGFDRGIMLRGTSNPHSLADKEPAVENAALAEVGPAAPPTIDNPNLIPQSKPYRRPDLRIVAPQSEHLLTFETELSTLGTKKESIPFTVEFSDGERRDLMISVELTRRAAALWNQVRLRFEPTQLRMKLKNELQLELDLHDSSGTESKS